MRGYMLRRPDVIPDGDAMDAETLADLYQRYAPLVHARARRIVGADADDVVQEVFMRLLKRPPAKEKTTSWIFSVSTNICLDLLRHRDRRHADWRNALREHLTSERSALLSDVLADRELCRRLLCRADRKTQQVVILVVFDEMGHQEAADALGITRKTVYSRLKSFTENANKMVRQWQT